MKLLVILAVTLLVGAAAGDDGSYSGRWSWQDSSAPQYGGPRPAQRPVGGPAPTDAVQKATAEFNRLYKEAADRAANAPDNHVTYESQRYDDHVSYQPQPHYNSPRPTKRPVGGPAPPDAVQKATEKFNRLYKEAAARAAAARDNHVTYESQRYDDHVSYEPQRYDDHVSYKPQPQYSSPRPTKRPVGGPAPADAVQKATEEFNRLYREAAARTSAASGDHQSYNSRRQPAVHDSIYYRDD